MKESMIRLFLLLLVFPPTSTLWGQQADFEVTDENVVQLLGDIEESFEPQRPWHTGPQAAAVHRVLTQLSVPEQYEKLWEYTFAESSEQGIRCITVICNVQSPPEAFARSLGQRPRPDVFATAHVGEVGGLFSSAWSLVNAAKEVGRLHELTEQVDRCQGPLADYLGLLTAIAGARGIAEETNEKRLVDFIAQLAQHKDKFAIQGAVVVAAAAKSQEYSGWAQRIDSALQSRKSIPLATQRLAREAIQKSKVTPAADTLRINEDWIRIGTPTAWYSFEDHVTHWSPRPSKLILRYPMAGDFSLQVEQVGGHESDWSSLGYESVDLGWNAYRRPQVNQRKIDKVGDEVRYAINGHPVRVEPATGTSPWLTLESSGLDAKQFRNFSLTGSPRVLEKVDLIASTSRGGWQTFAVDNDQAFWSVEEGILRSTPGDAPRGQTLLQYVRPLLEAETFEYEFFASDAGMVHPALGRIVFLLEPDGVKLHWVTDQEFEWTGLASDNAIIEPLYRRGPKPLPLRDQQWNRVSIQRTTGNIVVSLNGTEIYERPMEAGDDTRLGFFHEASTKSVLVRKATLSGDWPTEIRTENLMRPTSELDSEATKAAVILFPESVLQSNWRHIGAETQSLPPQERYALLRNWVLPGDLHSAFRVSGHFVPLQPPSEQRQDASDRGGRLVSPAIDLINLAKEQGSLDELAEEVRKATAESDDDRRAKAAMLALVHTANGQSEKAKQGLETLYRLVEANPKLPSSQLWPELLVAHELGMAVDTNDVLHDLLSLIDPVGFAEDDAVRSEIMRVLQFIRLRGEPVQEQSAALANWMPTERHKANRRASGGIPAAWFSSGEMLYAAAGRNLQQLFFKSPLTGDFEFQFEQFSRPRAWIHTLVAGVNHYGGAWEVKTGPIDGEFVANKLDEKVCVEGNWLHHRYAVENGVCKFFINGRLVHEHNVVEGFPWLALRQVSTHSTTVRDLRVSGNPTIPEVIRLDQEGLQGWHSYYRLDSFGPGSPWKQTGGEIVGSHSGKVRGSGDEQLLCYQVPLPDTHSIKYHFFYQPGKTIVHPALDRTAFVIAPEGVGLHYVTDGMYDNTFANKVNLQFNAEQQRSRPEKLLLDNQWNSMEVSVLGQAVELILNGESIFAGKIDSANERLFGFFYYADESSARAKDVTLRGDWPRELPSTQQQALANQTVAQLDASKQQLSAQFVHDFATDGFPNDLFTIRGTENAQVTSSDDGIGLTINSPTKWTQATLACNLNLSGDFDVTADFNGFKAPSGDAGFANLVLPLTSSRPLEAKMSRVRQGAGKTLVNAQMYAVEANGSKTYQNHRIGWEATAGTLRIARRGNRLHMLVKNSDARQFRLIKSYDSVDTPANQIQLMTIAQRADLVSVNWRKIEVRAEQISQIGGAVGERVILIGRGDGSEMRQLTKPIGDFGNHGSPEFSPDGKKIAFDTWKGSARTAHLFVVNVDGSGLKDLGIGTMPTFSPDGKQIVFSSDEGMMMMESDGSNRRVLSESGWGVQMSPLGNEVAFTDYETGGANIIVLDLKTNRKRSLLNGQQAARYSRIYWNFDWSPNGSEICFYAENRQTDQRELVTVSTAGSENGFKILGSGIGYANISWHPDGDRVIYSAHDRAYGTSLLFVVKVDDPTNPERLISDVRLQAMGGGDWTSDGKMLVVAGAISKRFSTQVEDDLVKKLDASRKMLSGIFEQNFTAAERLKEVLEISKGDAAIENNAGGLLITPGLNGGKPSEVLTRLQMVGDFDVTLQSNTLALGEQSAGEVQLSVPFASDDKLTLNVVKRLDRNGSVSVQARCVSNGDEILRETIHTGEPAGRLRVARRGTTVHMLYGASDNSEEELIASYEAGDAPTRNWGFRVVVTSPRDKTIQVQLNHLDIRAEKLLLTDTSAKQWRRVHTVNIDGSNARQVVGDLPGLAGHGSPKFSPDGKMIAFDTFRFGFSRSHVIVVNADGSQRRDLGQGSMPSFFPDGKRLGFTSNDGLMSMNIDGSDRQLLSRSGFSVKVSPDGKRVVFTDQARLFNLVGANLYVMDLETKKPRALLVGQLGAIYSEIQWNGAWSPDGTEFVFRGKKKADDQFHIAVVNTQGSDKGYEILRTGNQYTCDLGWHPDGKRIFVSRRNDTTGGHQLIFLPRDVSQGDELIPGQDPYHENFSSGVSSDGKQLVFTSNPLPEYSEQQ